MQREADLCFFFADHFGVEEVDVTDVWNEPANKLRCRRCQNLLPGVPREILIANWCPSCSDCPYDINDSERLDFHGYQLYRGRVNELTDLSVLAFPDLIPGDPGGAHRDHMVSVRDGFENNVPDTAIASPINLQWLPPSENLRKQRKSCVTIEELKTNYSRFAQSYPAWLHLVEWMESERMTCAAKAKGRFDERIALIQFLRSRGC